MMVPDRCGGRQRHLARKWPLAGGSTPCGPLKGASDVPSKANGAVVNSVPLTSRASSSATDAARSFSALVREIGALKRANAIAARRAARLSAEALSATQTVRAMELGTKRLLAECAAAEKQAREAGRRAAAREAEAERAELERIVSRIRRELDDARRDATKAEAAATEAREAASRANDLAMAAQQAKAAEPEPEPATAAAAEPPRRRSSTEVGPAEELARRLQAELSAERASGEAAKMAFALKLAVLTELRAHREEAAERERAIARVVGVGLERRADFGGLRVVRSDDERNERDDERAVPSSGARTVRTREGSEGVDVGESPAPAPRATMKTSDAAADSIDTRGMTSTTSDVLDDFVRAGADPPGGPPPFVDFLRGMRREATRLAAAVATARELHGSDEGGHPAGGHPWRGDVLAAARQLVAEADAQLAAVHAAARRADGGQDGGTHGDERVSRVKRVRPASAPGRGEKRAASPHSPRPSCSMPRRGRSPTRRACPVHVFRSRSAGPAGQPAAPGWSTVHHHCRTDQWTDQQTDQRTVLRSRAGLGGGAAPWAGDYGRVHDPRARWSPSRRGWGASDARAKMGALTPWRTLEEGPRRAVAVSGRAGWGRRPRPREKRGGPATEGERGRERVGLPGRAKRLLLAKDVDCSPEREKEKRASRPAGGTPVEWQRYWNSDYSSSSSSDRKARGKV